MSNWKREEITATADVIHALVLPDVVERAIRVYTPERSALVLGSTQPETDANAEVASALNVDIVRRRSGGGAVLVERNDMVWLDVLIARTDALWNDDVGIAFNWLGQVFAKVLAQLGFGDVEVYSGPLVTTPWSRKVCFAGLGPGECTLDGKKILGISQRRTRAGALFQCSVIRRFDAAKLGQLLDVNPADIAPSVGELSGLNHHLFVEAFVTALEQLEP